MKPIELEDNFDGHLILWCKGHYHFDDDMTIWEELRKIWSARCGLTFSSDNFLENVADRLYSIIEQTSPNFNAIHLQQIMHKELTTGHLSWHWVDKERPIQFLIRFYKSRIAQLKVKDTHPKHKHLPINESINTRYVTLVRLPKPQKRIFKKIIKGNLDINSKDYRKIM